jgi:hypothetical protein
MIIQRINRTNPEKVFIIVRNDTAAAIPQGYPVVFNFDGTRDGLDVEDCNTGDVVDSSLLAGFADTDIGIGQYALAQCYGVRDDVPMPSHGTATGANQVVGDAMGLFTASSIISCLTAGALSEYLPGIVCGQALASSGTSTVTAKGTVFLRLM